MNAHAKDRALYDAIIRNLGSGNTVAEAMAKNRQRGGIFVDHARTLRRAQLTLHRWSEEMCNGTIQRMGEDGEGRPFRVYPEPILIRGKVFYREPLKDNIPDREAGTLRRVAKVCQEAGLSWYYQRDPRGCALYVAAFPLDHSNYDRGVACL